MKPKSKCEEGERGKEEDEEVEEEVVEEEDDDDYEEEETEKWKEVKVEGE